MTKRTKIFCTIDDSRFKNHVFFDTVEVPTKDADRWINKLKHGIQHIINDLYREIKDCESD